MCEMLANQYFLSRRFSEAQNIFENILAVREVEDSLTKKLIICYTVNGTPTKAFPLFRKLIQKNPKIITDTDIRKDDCPCPEIIPKIHAGLITFEDHDQKNLALGILSLYCDIQNSIKYFTELRNSTLIPLSKLEEVISIIKNLKREPQTNQKVQL